MTLGRLFVFSLVLSMLCGAAFYLLVPGLLIQEPLFFDLRIGGYGDLLSTQADLKFWEDSGLVASFSTFYRWIDFVFPVGVFGLMVSSIWGLWGRAAKAIAFLGILVALGYLVADYVENVAVADLLEAGSAAVTLEQINTASSATQGKWVAVFASGGMIALGLVVTLFRGGTR